MLETFLESRQTRPPVALSLIELGLRLQPRHYEGNLAQDLLKIWVACNLPSQASHGVRGREKTIGTI